MPTGESAAPASGIAVHDAWAAYDTYTTATHVLCNAHVVRKLGYALGTVAGQVIDLAAQAIVALRQGHWFAGTTRANSTPAAFRAGHRRAAAS